MSWNEGPLLGFDLETTGVDPGKDLPVQVALVRWEPRTKSRREVFIVDPGREIPGEAEAIHGVSTRRARREGCPLEDAAAIVHAVLETAQAERVPIVAMNASFDITITTVLFRNFGLRPIEWGALVDPLVIDRGALSGYRRLRDRRADALPSRMAPGMGARVRLVVPGQRPAGPRTRGVLLAASRGPPPPRRGVRSQQVNGS